MGIEDTRREFRLMAEGHAAGLPSALAPDGPVSGSGRLLNDIASGHTIPRDDPTDSPAMPGAHFPSIHEIDAAVGHLAYA